MRRTTKQNRIHNTQSARKAFKYRVRPDPALCLSQLHCIEVVQHEFPCQRLNSWLSTVGLEKTRAREDHLAVAGHAAKQPWSSTGYAVKRTERHRPSVRVIAVGRGASNTTHNGQRPIAQRRRNASRCTQGAPGSATSRPAPAQVYKRGSVQRAALGKLHIPEHGTAFNSRSKGCLRIVQIICDCCGGT